MKSVGEGEVVRKGEAHLGCYMKGRERDLPTCDLSSAVDGWCTGESPVAARAGREERVARASEIPTRVDAP